ncbi:hypothetical protein AZ044_001697 [Pluralibacter gergoviae]|nr:hypothetical protein [Pluralibacter gergoviae]OUF43686.1 hypothetical protein AZ034_004351 [Pluralibacter gergoviae]OUF55447.1 hypothetical protein AZ044_001697 [Pluralibacter gergoviae]
MAFPGAVNILIPRLTCFSLITRFIEPLSDDAAIIQTLPDGIGNNPYHRRFIVRLRGVYPVCHRPPATGHRPPATGQRSGGYFHALHQRQHPGLWVTLWLALFAKGVDKPRDFITARGCYSVIESVLQFSRNAEFFQIGFTHW